jgi:hypothetical protein
MKIVERRCVMLGLCTPQTAVLQIVDAVKPYQETGIDKIERVLAELAAQDNTSRPPVDRGWKCPVQPLLTAT